MATSRLLAFLLLFGLVPSGWSECISYSEALKHIGATKCITGNVLRVKQGNGGLHFFEFCEDHRMCPFTVIVFPGDLKRVGGRLEGRQIETDGEVKGYDGRAEINPPTCYTAGKFSYPTSAKRSP